MRTTLELPADLVEEIKRRAAQEGRTLKDEVAALLRLGLAKHEAPPQPANGNSQPSVARKAYIRLPLIECAEDAPARTMTNEQLEALIDETQTKEDIERLGLSL